MVCDLASALPLQSWSDFKPDPLAQRSGIVKYGAHISIMTTRAQIGYRGQFRA